MDFRSLSRRELQALCKRNKIPANLTNVAMADALAALPSVEGIEEFLNGEGSGVPESPMKEEAISSEIPRTALRTSTRRKPVKDETITTRTRRAAAARCTEESENRDQNVALTTPSLPSGRRRTVAASSACKKVDFQMTVDVVEKEDNDLDQEKNAIETTPAVPKSQKRVGAASTSKRTETRNNGATTGQRVYSTRRSVRLLEKNMESLSLGEDAKMEPITVHMSFDEMPASTGPVKEDTDIEIESKKTEDDNLELEIDNQEENKVESEVKLSEVEPETDLDSLNKPAGNPVTAMNCDDSEIKVPDDNSNVKCVSEDEEEHEASKDDDVVEISAEEINDSVIISPPTENVDLTEVQNSSIVEESGKDVEQYESVCELEYIIEEESEEDAKPMNISAVELSLPHENVDEETQMDDVLISNVEESVMGEKDGQNECVYESEPTIEEEEKEELEMKDGRNECVHESEPTMDENQKGELDADSEGDKKEMDNEMVPDQAEEDETTIKSMEFPENVSDNFVDVKILWQMEEEAQKNINVDAIDSQPKIPNDIQCEEEALVEVSVTSREEIIPSFAADQRALASQFPRPTVETKSPLKDQTIRLLMDNSDAEEEDEDEKEQEKADCIQRQIVEKNDMSLRQLKKMFKEKLQLSKKKMDNNNTKVVDGGKVRTALQPLPENRMTMNELEKRF